MSRAPRDGAVEDRTRVEWRPSATLDTLRQRAALLTRARGFFAARGILEVETPVLSAAATTDPQIESLTTHLAGHSGRHFLNTSPEYPMKRLLASGSGDIFQVCKVFRDAECGRWHNPEFTMVEWYRLGFDDAGLMTEVEDLVADLLAPYRRLAPAERLTYAETLRRYAGVDAHEDGDAVLDQAAVRHGIACDTKLGRDAKLDLLMGLVAGPRLGVDRPCFICDYPASQASLARLKPGLPRVAARFELYIDGIELANGFHELVNAAEQRGRFSQDLASRRAQGQNQPPLDARLLAALEYGMPDCAGVALGFDRLVAVALGASRLSDVMTFSIDTA